MGGKWGQEMGTVPISKSKWGQSPFPAYGSVEQLEVTWRSPLAFAKL